MAEIERRRLVRNLQLCLASLLHCLRFLSVVCCVYTTDFINLFTFYLCIYFFFKEGKLSYEEAILARQTMIKDNQQRVMEMKEEVSIMPEDS